MKKVILILFYLFIVVSKGATAQINKSGNNMVFGDGAILANFNNAPSIPIVYKQMPIFQ